MSEVVRGQAGLAVALVSRMRSLAQRLGGLPGRCERRVGGEERAAVAGVQEQLEALVADVVRGEVDGLKGEACPSQTRSGHERGISGEKGTAVVAVAPDLEGSVTQVEARKVAQLETCTRGWECEPAMR